MRGFLWCQGSMRRGKAKVSWESVCLPKNEGGLGIQRLETFNVALITYHIWSILTLKESLWVKWVHTHKLRVVMFWFGEIEWEMTFLSQLVLLGTIRPRGNTIGWTYVVWFAHCIPRHAFHLWLVIQKKLKTQDRLKQWDVSPTADLNLSRCPLCDLVPDSHDHLFFHCPLSSQVWSKVKVKANMHNNSCSMDDIVNWLSPFAKKKSGMGIVAKLVLAASTYFIWQERNSRLFKKNKRSQAQVEDLILATVRLKLLTFSFKKSSRMEALLTTWNVPKSLLISGT
ncbi:reverse transcriptase domain, reverse transcriptase zinc-binding domain protein [Tanacetum coccineum]